GGGRGGVGRRGQARGSARRGAREDERPGVERDAGWGPRRQDRKIASDVLPRRNAPGIATPPLTAKAARDHAPASLAISRSPLVRVVIVTPNSGDALHAPRVDAGARTPYPQ